MFLAQDISGQVNSSVTGFVSGIQDTIVEGPEVFIVELASVLDDFSSVVTLRPSPSTVTVLDDDGMYLCMHSYNCFSLCRQFMTTLYAW